MPGPQALDALMPVYDVSDAVAVVADADPDTAWEAVFAVDLIALGKQRRLVGILGATRALPELALHLFKGERPPRPPPHLTLVDTADLEMGDGGWLLLARDDRQIALGLVGKLWRPVIEYASVPDVEAFRAFATPGYAKTIYALSADELEDGRTQLSAVMRTATTDEQARRWFGRYWTLGVGAGAHVLARSLLEAARDAAERSPGS
jgi:hypothetical protein